jgi:RNA polymerase-binding transcription factor DksA
MNTIQTTTTTRTSYSQAELKMFKTLIESKILEAKNNIDFYQGVDKNENSGNARSKPFEDTCESISHQQNAIFIASQQKFLLELTNALIRMATNSYGICRETGELIPKERLMLVPHTTTCVQAKNQRN